MVHNFLTASAADVQCHDSTDYAFDDRNALILGDLLCRAQYTDTVPLNQRVHNILFRLEVIIQRSPRDSDLCENIVCTCAIKALLTEKLIRRIKYFIFAFFSFLYRSHYLLHPFP
ncbi:hypothetical protein D3C81_2036540 [compost metagenome]